MTANRVQILLVAWESDRTGPAGDLLLLLPRLPADRLAATVVFRHEAGPLAIELQHAGAVVLDLGIGESERATGAVATLAAVHRLVRIMRDLAPTIAHGLDEPSSALVAIAGRVSGVPVLVGTRREHRRARPGWLRRAAIRRLDHVVVASGPLDAELHAAGIGARPPTTVVARGIDAVAVRGRIRSADFPEPRPRVGTFLRLDAQGPILTVLEAAKILRESFPDLEWLVAGIGSDGVRCLRLVQAEGLETCVRLLGDREDEGEILAALDAYVDPGGADALPSGLLKALAAGVPCIAARNPTLESALSHDRDAVLVAPGDPASLASGIERVLAESGGPLRTRLRASGPAAVRGFDAGSTASALVSLYESLMTRAKA